MAEVAKGLAKRDVLQVQAGTATAARDRLAEEVPVAVHVDGAPFAVMMASPGDLVDFGTGFALTECGLAPGDLAAVEVHEQLEGVALDLRTRAPAASPAPERGLPGRSGCGLCGSRHLEDVLRRPPPVGEGITLAPGAVEAALAALQARQPLNAATGAIHAAAWCDPAGRVLEIREDVGRHNALDKLIGALLRQGRDPAAGFALVTSRASYEMVTKAARAGLTVLVAMSAPTALAVDLAGACGLSLAGFARPGRHVVYSHSRRFSGQA